MEKIRFFKEILDFPLLRWLVVYRIHATKRMFERDIDEPDLLFSLGNGIVIENYPGDFPFPSFLVNGKTARNSPLHVVVAVNRDEKILYIITVYIPDQAKWINDFSERRLS